MPSPDQPAGFACVVTIDGPAGTGKSSVARALAERLGFEFLDTGAMFRLVAGECLRRGIDPEDGAAAAGVAAAIDYDPRVGITASLGQSLRTVAITQAASLVARHEGVREVLVRWQRSFAAGRRVVTEGRDQGTIVFPAAAAKFYLDATAEERASRRVGELRRLGEPVDADATLRQIRERDRRDRTRAVAPLRPADDALTVDTTTLSIDEVVSKLEQTCRAVLAGSL